jgi:hypothetical protein
MNGIQGQCHPAVQLFLDEVNTAVSVLFCAHNCRESIRLPLTDDYDALDAHPGLVLAAAPSLHELIFQLDPRASSST